MPLFKQIDTADELRTLRNRLYQERLEKELLARRLEEANRVGQAVRKKLRDANEELCSEVLELRRANARLRATSWKAEEYEDQFSILFSNAAAHVMLIDGDLTVRRINHLPDGASVEAIEGRSCLRLVARHRREVYTAHFEKARRTRQIVEVVDEIPQPSGTTRHFVLKIVPLQQGQDDTSGFLLIARDRTALASAQLQLRKQAVIYQNLYQYGKETMTRIDTDGTVIDINCSLLGLAKEELIGKSVYQIAPPEVIKNTTDAFEAVMSGEQPFVDYFTELVDVDGNQVLLQSLLFPVRVEDQVVEVVIKTRDISELKRSEQALKELSESLEQQVEARSEELEAQKEALQEANSYLDSFVNGAAHDLRAPITQIKGFLMLARDLEDPEQIHSILKELEQATYNMERTLNGMIDLIDFARETGSGSVRVDLSAIVLETIDGLFPMLEEAKGTICVDMPPRLEFGYIQPYLKSVCYNLLANAIKYRSYERSLRVIVSARRETDYVVLSIKDNGIGIDMERFGQHLFQPFKRLTAEREGTGIGLSIINKVVRRNGGYIEVDSSLGKGARFTVYLKSMPV